MRVLLFGATGMLGHGVLRECLLASDVKSVVSIGRGTTGQQHEKLREIVHKDFTDFSSIEHELTGHDACFYCLGATSSGMSEADYTRLTYDFTMAAAQVLARLNPKMTFVYVSGAGTDSTERGRIMWARIKGRTENALLELPFKAAYMFRPGAIQPLHGAVSKTQSYRILYALARPLWPVAKALFPGQVTSTELIGRAMLNVARRGAPKRVLESPDIHEAARVVL